MSFKGTKLKSPVSLLYIALALQRVCFSFYVLYPWRHRKQMKTRSAANLMTVLEFYLFLKSLLSPSQVEMLVLHDLLFLLVLIYFKLMSHPG